MQKPEPQRLERRTWDEFAEAGLFWWINRSLHLFGWALVREVDAYGKVIEVYPARCHFRGFDPKTEEIGFIKLTKHLTDSASGLIEDMK